MTGRAIMDRLTELEKVCDSDTGGFIVLLYDVAKQQVLEEELSRERSLNREAIILIPCNGRDGERPQ